MTKEELKQEAEEYYEDETEGTFQICEDCYWFADAVQTAYVDSAEPREKRIEELEAEVKEWKDKADLWCKTANLKDHNIMINKELEKENADLKEEINKIAFARGNLEEENAELKEELKKWKDEWQEQVQKATDEGYARTLQTIQLTKAKEIIKELMSFSVQLCDCRHTVDFEKTREEAEQFLKGDK